MKNNPQVVANTELIMVAKGKALDIEEELKKGKEEVEFKDLNSLLYTKDKDGPNADQRN